MELPKEFFTPQSFATFFGATAVVWVVTSALQKAFAINPAKWGFFISEVTAFIGAGVSGTLMLAVTLPALLTWVVAFLNGCLLFCTVAGIKEGEHSTTAGVNPHGAQKRFFGSWFHN